MSSNSIKTSATSIFGAVSQYFSKQDETLNHTSQLVEYDSDFDVYSDDESETNSINKDGGGSKTKTKTNKKKTKDSLNTGLMSKKKILHIGTTLQGIVQTMKDSGGSSDSRIPVPKIVVVGSQSAGKSSLLNGILSFDLLPTDKSMCTRAPLHLELIPSKQDAVAEFGNYNCHTGLWDTICEVPFELPVPTKEQRDKIRDQINIITNKLAGNESNITNKPINLKIYAPNIPNLTMVDLPGMVMVARTDKGQPTDIKNKINELISSYIEEPKTIILAVMPARTDIEADIAMELIKRHDPEGKRTIGILTKVDLMNVNTDISDYLQGNISRDLHLKYGYYAVRNRAPEESKNISVVEGFQREKAFFKNHPAYSNLTGSSKAHLGIPNMTNRISDILVKNIKHSLPHILTKVNERLVFLNQEFVALGNPLPETEEAKTAFAHNLLTNFTRSLCDALNNRGSPYDTGRCIKEILVKYREQIRGENPFNELNTNKKLIQTTIKNSAGNHMTSPSPPIEVLEQCLRDINSQPMMKLTNTSNKCIKDVCDQVIYLIETLLKNCPIYRFPNLYKKIKGELNGNYIIEALEKTRTTVDSLMYREQNYIWTDDEHFHELLGNANAGGVDSEAPSIVNYVEQSNLHVQPSSLTLKSGVNTLLRQNQKQLSHSQSHSNFVARTGPINKQERQKLKQKNKKPDLIKRMNDLLKAYYDTYIDVMANAVPKIIMYDFIHNIQTVLMCKFNECVLKLPISELLEENGERAKKRKILTEERVKLSNIKKVIQDI